MKREKNASLGLWHALRDAVIGTVLELGRKKSSTLTGRLGAMLPLRVKAAALGAVKAGGAEAIEAAKESFGLGGTGRSS